MDIITLICLSLSLAADAFVTAIVDGLAYSPKAAKRIAIAISFGVAQGAMPILGALFGEKLLGFLNAQSYLAFAALFIVGALMFIEGLDKKTAVAPRLGVKTISFQAFATSVDAFACGLTLTTLDLPLWVGGVTIGGITTLLCAIGIFFAGAIGKRVAKPQRFKIIGGCVLIALALKNLVYCFI